MKKNVLKKLLSAALVLAMAATTLTACGKEEAPAEDAATEDAAEDEAPAEDAAEEDAAAEVAWDTSKKDTIVLSVINNFYTAGEKYLAEEYMKLHPETEVVVDVIADNDSYVTKMTTAIESMSQEVCPDIVHSGFLGLANYDVAFEKGILYDMGNVLEMENPYYDNQLVKDTIDAKMLEVAHSQGNYKFYPLLPLDCFGIGVAYNADVLNELGLEVPTSIAAMEECAAALKEAGYEYPISATLEVEHVPMWIADAKLRYTQADYLYQESDAGYTDSMSANIGFTFDDNNLSCDAFTSVNKERLYAALAENGIPEEDFKYVYETYKRVAQYFPLNYLAEESTNALVNFETGLSPLLFMPSYMVGNVNQDMQALPEDQQFAWGATRCVTIEEVGDEANLPEGYSNVLRGNWGIGNGMGIFNHDGQNGDHLARVIDFFMYWYSKEGVEDCYAKTLEAGNYVQGPTLVKGVELDPELSAILEGFRCEPFKGELVDAIIGRAQTIDQATEKKAAIMDYMSGKISIDDLYAKANEINGPACEEFATESGWDWDFTT